MYFLLLVVPLLLLSKLRACCFCRENPRKTRRSQTKPVIPFLYKVSLCLFPPMSGLFLCEGKYAYQ